ncbi:signal transduction histidine kinase [Clostridium punense]|uniref:histidine kinase n=1 Tax=Clostridium punense TaxID=1054297 RepID=A0ABS4K5G4_9CLOT|nr:MULTISPECIES: HAMP domain-containing sensor histidine kinase [Clostridium]EQB89676.1 hypothetical protein M918_19410 [Clostridium sp. BL8]MBP2022396.1 signal transduction histidine kinase [Clostridium punense]
MDGRITVRGSVAKKLFLITVILFISFLAFTLITQRVFFEKMYYNKKEVDIQSNVEKFRQILVLAQSEEEVLLAMKDFEDRYNTSMAIVDTERNITVVFNTGHKKIDADKQTLVKDIVNEFKYNSDLQQELNTRGKITFVATDPRSNTNSLVSVVVQNSQIVLGFTSMQSIKEAVGVIEIFYKYFYLAAIVIIILLSSVYTRMITSPLKRINKVAMKMGHLDFSEKCVVNSQDEIGSLANSLNFLSSELQHSLNSLQSANAKLRQDIDKERKLEIMRKEFIADVSHELKTPITLIKGYAEGIKDDVFSKEEVDYSLDVIISESDKMGNLVKDMLELSTLESETAVLKTEVCSIGQIIEGTIKKLTPSINEKKIKVHMDLERDLKFKGDCFKLEQVVTNFLTNAVRHTNLEGDIWISTKTIEGKGVVSFENSGAHIEEEALSKIWDKFYKEDKSRNRKLGGTGLGLSIVRKIIELHKGEYGVKNTERGVMFYFIIKREG